MSLLGDVEEGNKSEVVVQSSEVALLVSMIYLESLSAQRE